MAAAAPLSGLRVLDVTQGPVAIIGMILADYGADVIKLEPPCGERFRSLPAFRQWNRGKRSAAIDLTTPTGREAVTALATSCDMVVQSFRPGVAERLGFGQEQLQALNDALIYVSISGFGRQDRLSAHKSYEGIVAAKTGQFLIQNGYRKTGPIYDAVPKCTFGAAMLALIGGLAALHRRDRSGSGAVVETSLMRSNYVYSYDGVRGADAATTKQLSMVQGRDPHNVMPGYRISECADGRWIQSGSAAAGIFDNFARALGIDAFFSEPRFAVGVGRLAEADRDDLIAMIDAAYRTRTHDEWVSILTQHDAAFGIFLTTQEFMEYPQVVHNGLVEDIDDPVHGPMRQIGPLVRFAGSERHRPGPAPLVGEHTDEVLAESLGMARPSPLASFDVSGARSAPVDRPLEGVTVLDLSMYAASPGGPGLLADLGATVVKIEPMSGDPLSKGPAGGGELFFRVNRGKQRIAIDLKLAEGQAIIHRLVERADVLVHNFRPGVPERIGVGYDRLRTINDRLVYVYGASFGSTGPDAHRPAFDAVISAMAGGEVLQAGRGNPPQQRQTTDHSALLGVATAILLGLRQRDVTGTAQNIETTMLASAAYLFSDDFVSYAGKPDRPMPDAGQYGLHALYRLYPAADRTWLFLACPFDDEWSSLCDAMPELLDDHRFQTATDRAVNDADLAEALASAFLAQPAAHWEQLLAEHDVACVSADATWSSFLFDGDDHPDAPIETFEVAGVGRVRQAGASIDLGGAPNRVGVPVGFGASTHAILTELGYSSAEIDGLYSQGVVARPA